MTYFHKLTANDTMKNSLLAVAIPVAILTGCATPMYLQEGLPAPVQVPAGHAVVLESVGRGQITYECRARKDNTSFDWVLVGPEAKLTDRQGKQIGRYYGPPATWESADGSKVTGAQVAVTPAAAGSIPLQLVKTNPATGTGAMQGVTFIQRVTTKGGVAPSSSCAAATSGKKENVSYQADYIFYKAR